MWKLLHLEKENKTYKFGFPYPTHIEPSSFFNKK